MRAIHEAELKNSKQLVKSTSEWAAVECPAGSTYVGVSDEMKAIVTLSRPLPSRPQRGSRANHGMVDGRVSVKPVGGRSKRAEKRPVLAVQFFFVIRHRVGASFGEK